MRDKMLLRVVLGVQILTLLWLLSISLMLSDNRVAVSERTAAYYELAKSIADLENNRSARDEVYAELIERQVEALEFQNELLVNVR